MLLKATSLTRTHTLWLEQLSETNLSEAGEASYGALAWLFKEREPFIATNNNRIRKKIETPDNSILVRCYPNPFATSFTIIGLPPDTKEIRLINTAGELIYIKKVSQLNEVQIHLNKHAGGIYHIQWYDASGVLMGLKDIIKIY